MLYETVDRASIEKLVREFYKVIMKDDIVGPFFIKKLGNDMKNDRWYEHLILLDNFWQKMMLGESLYNGHPYPPHAFLGPLSTETFDRWLELFYQTTHNLFIPEIADKFYDKAKTLAEQFMDNLGLNDDEDWD